MSYATCDEMIKKVPSWIGLSFIKEKLCDVVMHPDFKVNKSLVAT